MSMLNQDIEPITETPLRGHGKVRAFEKPEEYATAIVVFQDVFGSTSAQQNLYELAKRLLDRGGFQWIFVEGARGLLDATYAHQFGATLEKRVAVSAPVSPGILQLLDAGRPDVQVWGVDDMALLTEHHTVQKRCTMAREPWGQLVRDFREALTEAKQTTQYTELMHWVSRCLVNWGHAPQSRLREDDDRPLSEQVTELLRVGTSVGLDSAFFPMLTQFRKTLSIEESLDFQQIEQERMAFVKELVYFDKGWWQRHEPDAVVDLARALPAIRFWLTKTQRSEAEVELEVATRGISAMLRRCQTELIGFLIGSSLKYREHMLSPMEFYNDLLSLGLRLNVDMSRFPGLLRYCSYVEDAAAISAERLHSQLQHYATDLMERLISTPAQREVYALEKSVSLLARAGTMELAPHEVDALVEEMTWPVLKKRLSPFSTRAREIRLPRKIDAMARAAVRFGELSAQRSRRMTEEAVRQLAAHGGTGAILVCGGHHTADITRRLKGRPDIAWSTITPDLRLEDLKR